MKIVKILTFLTLSFFLDITIHADIDYSQKIEYKGAFDKFKITNNGILLGENATLYPLTFFNGIYLSKDLNFNFSKKTMEGSKITDIDATNNEIFVTTDTWYDNSYPGLYKITNNFQNIERIGRFGWFNKVHIFKDKVYYGGGNYGAWVVKTDGSDNKQLLGSNTFGPQIDQIKSNSDKIFVLSRGNLYFTEYNKDSLSQILPIYRISNIEPTENEIFATSYDKFLIMDFQGKIKYEKSFSNQLRVLKKYQNYIFLTEVSPSEQKIWISNDSGKTFYESKTKFTPGDVIKDIDLTGKDNISIFIHINNLMILKAKFNFDFEENRFLSIPFKVNSTNQLVDKITSFFDHRYPYLGNLKEPEEFSETTLNFYGSELKKPLIYYSSHDGIDFGLPMYSDVYASEKGVASYVYNPGGLGNAIIISHPNNYLTVYGHLDEQGLITKNSIEVNKGEIIGRVGMSGNTNGPHLHFTTYKGSKILDNKVDPFGWQGSFEDPWKTKSTYLWSSELSKLNQELNLNKVNIISNDHLELKLNQIANDNFYHLTFVPLAPVFDRANFKYKENTSYKLEMSNLLNEKVVSFASVRFKGFTNPQDEKNYSIFKYDGQSLIKMETMFNQESNTLSTYTNLDGQYMVLEYGFKRISAKSNFKTTQ